ncbi:odorant receptor Or2-like [Cylas formicarius]|uniref:odorant receptor Or2-like n=1 Tax=Cylas formicarius TaxID=197179 RepID=UPI00295874DA|nr:odorant receptor Or2-like [Cylas formicarius]
MYPTKNPPQKWEQAYSVPARFLKLAGVWHQDSWPAAKRIQHILFFILCVLFDVAIYMELANLVTSNDYEMLSEHLSPVGFYTSYTIAIVVFKANGKKFKKMTSSLESSVFNDLASSSLKIKERCIFESNRLSTFFLSTVGCSLVIYLARPLYSNYSLPISFSYSVNGIKYFLVYSLQIVSVIYLIITGISLVMLNISLLNIASALIDVLNQSVAGLGQLSGVGVLVQRHSVIIRFVQEIDEVFTYISLTRCLTSIISICNGLFQLTHTRKIPSVTFVFNVVYVFNVLFEIGIYCWFATALTEKSLTLTDACYNYDWPEESLSNQRSLLMITARSQKPFYVTAGKFARLGVGSFLSLVKMAYSYFALMQSLYEKTEDLRTL